MDIELYDEVPSPQRCACCGRAWAPPPDTWVFCPDCHACHVGRRLPAHPVGIRLVNEWMRSFTGEGPMQWAVQSGYRFEGRYLGVHGAEVIQCEAGYSVLVERGQADSNPGPPYVLVRLAGFAASPPSLDGVPRSRALQTLRVRRWGLELFLTDAHLAAAREAGRDHVVAELTRVAAAVGLEPIFEGSDADLDALPPDVRGAVEPGDSTLRCDHCGAPVALADLGSRTECPYCEQPAGLSPEVCRELEGQRRLLDAQDATHRLDGTDLWERWAGHEAPAHLACAVCGAPCPHRPGVFDARCGHCGAMVIPSLQRLRDDAQGARDQWLAFEQRRQARRRAAADRERAVAGRSASLILGFAVGGGLMIAVSVVVYLLASRSAGGDWWGPALGASVMLLGALPFLAIPYMRRRLARRAVLWERVWSRIAEQLDASSLESADPWLDVHWSSADRAATGWTGPSPAFGAVAGEVEGTSVLIAGDLEGGSVPYLSVGGAPWLRIYIAVEWSEDTGILKASRGIRARRRELAAAGFGTCLRRRGFELSADPETLSRLRAHPEQAAVVVPVLFEALRIGRLVGGAPARVAPGAQPMKPVAHGTAAADR